MSAQAFRAPDTRLLGLRREEPLATGAWYDSHRADPLVRFASGTHGDIRQGVLQAAVPGMSATAALEPEHGLPPPG